MAINGSADGAFIQVGDNTFVLSAEAIQALQQTPYESPKLEDIDQPQLPGGLPPGSRMTFLCNEVFTGREQDLLVLAKDIFEQAGPTLVTQSIVGMGGVGKTQLAVEFCYRYGRYFHGVHWMDPTSVRSGEEESVQSLKSKVEGEIAACGAQMLLPDWPEERPEQVRLTLAAWRESGPRLVVLDNLEEVEGAREVLKLLQAGGRSAGADHGAQGGVAGGFRQTNLPVGRVQGRGESGIPAQVLAG